MTTNECVTLFHYDEDSETFSRLVFPHASVYRKTVAAVSENGLVMDSVIQIRIPVSHGEQTNEETEIARIQRAETESETEIAHQERANEAECDKISENAEIVTEGNEIAHQERADEAECDKISENAEIVTEGNEIARYERANETETNAHQERANQTDDAVINVGDYVFIGVSEDSKPDRGLCHKVLGFSQNMRGANPHIRIEAK